MPKVSIVVPTYNVEDFLRASLDSLIEQTLSDFEVICVNDCSTDGTAEILAEYALKDSRFKVIENPVNRGPGPTRNAGIDIARGEYLYLHDSDDRISPDYFERMVGAIEKSGAEVVLNLNIVRCAGNKYAPYQHPTMPTCKKEGEWVDRVRMLEDSPVFVQLRLYRRDFIERYHLRFLDERKLDDEYFHRLVHVRNEKTFVFFGPLFLYTIRKSSIMGGIVGDPQHDMYMLRVFDVMYREYKKLGLLNTYQTKMFYVAPFYNIDSEEKFDAFHKFFSMIQEEHYQKMEHLYNELERFFFKSIMSAKDYSEFKAVNRTNPSLNYLFSKRKGLVK